MLHIFLIVLAVMAFIAANVAVFTPVVRSVNRVMDEEATMRQIAPTLVRCGAALVVVWTLGIYAASRADNDADHCGSGTRYVEHHVGKHTEWQCVAKED